MQLGKRYAQDNPLDWGIAADKKSEDLVRHAPEGATLKAKRESATEEAEDQGKTAKTKSTSSREDT